MCIHLIDVMCKSETHITCELLKICLQTMVDCFVQNANSRSAVCRSRRPDVNLSVLYTRISPQMLSYLLPSAAGLLTTSSARWATVYSHVFYVEFYNKLLHYYTHLVAYFFRTTWLSRYQKGKTSLDLNEARDDGFLDAVASAGPYANNLHLAPDTLPHQQLITQFLQAGCSS